MSFDIFKKPSFWGQILWWGTIVLIGILTYEPKPRLETPQRDIFVDDLDKRPLFLLAEEKEEAVHWLTLNLYHEARGKDEGREGLPASAWVVINRVRSYRFPDSVLAVIHQPGREFRSCAFSWHCDGKSDVPKNSESFSEIKILVGEILAGRHPDPTGGALFYYNPEKASPCWGKARSFIKVIGNHRFYGDIPWPEMKALCRPAQPKTQIAQAKP